ncbi:hypothetical protein HED55_11235 [Ochrobactrum haematophilum]|uniref:Uncharacterized protein n=1 Tax=Brucella haematophila TaxID=419474 RepID=A0ABX1DMP2_9HYPH|nr:hypothetical protein [Brucella haematophila]
MEVSIKNFLNNGYLTIGKSMGENVWGIGISNYFDPNTCSWNISENSENEPTTIQLQSSFSTSSGGLYLGMGSNSIELDGYDLRYAVLSNDESNLIGPYKIAPTTVDLIGIIWSTIVDSRDENWKLFSIQNDKSNLYFLTM